MKVAFIIRSTAQSTMGGDWVQSVSTAKYLKRLGIQVDIHLAGEKVDYPSYQLLHFFNLIRPDDILKHIRHTRVPFVVSSIYVDYNAHNRNSGSRTLSLLNRFLNADRMEYAKRIGRSLRNGEPWPTWEYLFRGHAGSIQKVLNRCSGILPNSEGEFNRLKQHFEIQSACGVVPNGIDTEVFIRNPHAVHHRENVVCAGRIEPRKNQLNLIRALRDTEFTLYIVGSPSPNHQAYADRCRDESAGNVHFIEPVKQEELIRIYENCKVHALPSWFETTGLSSLEAAYLGCNIVITDKGDAEDYFGRHAFYCNPAEVESIRDAVFRAAQAPVSRELTGIISKEFTWHKAAEETYKMYKTIIQAA